MEIKNEQQYQQALTELKVLEEGPADDERAARRQELEAAAAHYAERLRGTAPRKGRADPH